MQIAVKALVLFVSLLAPSTQQYAAVTVNPDGTVTVTTSDGSQISPPRLAPDNAGNTHVGAAQPLVSPDRQSVGWLALFNWCCTSYPIPLRVVLLRNGRLSTLQASQGEPIWFWSFQDGGKRLAFRQAAPHGGTGLHYELWDVQTAKRVAIYAPEYDENGQEAARPNEPHWVKMLDAAEKRAQK